MTCRSFPTALWLARAARLIRRCLPAAEITRVLQTASQPGSFRRRKMVAFLAGLYNAIHSHRLYLLKRCQHAFPTSSVDATPSHRSGVLSPAVRSGAREGSDLRRRIPPLALRVDDRGRQWEKPAEVHPGLELDYNPSFSPDGQWVVFTSERKGQADIYRVKVDGMGLERLTDSPAFDDQGVCRRMANPSRLSRRATKVRSISTFWISRAGRSGTSRMRQAAASGQAGLRMEKRSHSPRTAARALCITPKLEHSRRPASM